MSKQTKLVKINGVLTSVRSRKNPAKPHNPVLQDLRTNPHFCRRQTTKSQKALRARGDTWDRRCKHKDRPNVG